MSTTLLTFSFEKDEQILCAPFAPDTEQIGDRFESLKLGENLSLCAALVRNSPLEYLHSIGRPIYGYRPIRFLAIGPNDNLLTRALPSGLSNPPWLARHPLFIADVRIFNFDRQAPFVGIAFDVRTRRLIRLTCKELLEDGFSLIDFYVGRLISTNDPRIERRLELVGRDNKVRLQLFALAYNLGNFLRSLVLPKKITHWSMTTLREKLIKSGAKFISGGRYVRFQMAEVAVSRRMFSQILKNIAKLRPPPAWT